MKRACARFAKDMARGPELLVAAGAPLANFLVPPSKRSKKEVRVCPFSLDTTGLLNGSSGRSRNPVPWPRVLSM
jgi:hypothetical protein